MARDLKTVLNSIKLSDRGVYVQASTLGSLEALLEFLKQSKIPVSAIFVISVVVLVSMVIIEFRTRFICKRACFN